MPASLSGRRPGAPPADLGRTSARTEVRSRALTHGATWTYCSGSVPAPTIIDVGANEGQSAKRFAHIWPRAQIHCFEPSPSTFALLEQNVGGVHANIHLVNAGVGARRSRELLLESSHPDMSSFLEPTAQAWGQTQSRTSVEMLTLDDYCKERGVGRIDLLKSDTQGYDLEVLLGAERLLAGGLVRAVYIEVLFAELYEHAPPLDVIYRFLADRGYRFVCLYEPFFSAEGHMTWCDALFVHPQREIGA